jgi:hypothetical protein
MHVRLTFLTVCIFLRDLMRVIDGGAVKAAVGIL